MSEGDIIPLRAVPSIDYFVSYFAIHINRGIVVPLASDISEEIFWQYKEYLKTSSVPEGTADILFTTGTTGKSKGAIISYETIIANSENLIAAHGYNENLSFIICSPLNHYGAWSKVFPCIMQGMTIYLLEGLKAMDRFFEVIDSSATKIATFMVPSSIKMLMQLCSDRLSNYADRIAFLETGGAPMSEGDMKRLCQLLPNASLFNTYASTESGIITTYNYQEGCISGCVGRPLKNSSVAISSQGHILCSGKTLMTGYLDDPLLTSKILQGGAVEMSDKGIIDEEGRLHILGRDDDVINTGAYKVNPLEVEDAANEYAGIRECICIAAPHIILGTALKLLYTTHDGKEISKKDLARYLLTKLEKHKVPLLYEQVPSIQMTFNGKKDRKHYRH
jgi:acyl-CoA synthetase (AMP-forming)/AMP-acid ligase II